MDKIKFNFISVTPDNVTEYGVFCIKEKNTPGSQAKINWCKCKGNEGVQIKIAVNGQNKQVGFIEFIPAESAWRPVKADNYLFIHCIAVFVKDARNKNLGSLLIKSCEEEAHKLNKAGVCIMTSNGRWMADKALFVKNGYEKVDERGRYELMVKKFKPGSQLPALIDWEVQQKKFKGWNLLYADQCPWNAKSAAELKETAKEYNVNLKIKKISNVTEAKLAPSGFGVFSLLKDGRLLEDHYISNTRFKNILKKELTKK